MTDLLSLITPTNLLSEQEKFLASSTYHPTFRYIWHDESIEPEFSTKLKYPLWEAIKVQDRVGIVSAAKELFEVEIDQALLAQAYRHAKVKGKVSVGSAEEICHLFREAFEIFDLDYQLVITDAPGYNIRPSHKNSTLYVSKHIHFDYFSMDAEVHHELVHILRYKNGKFNDIKRSPNFLPTEEGLASWCQDNTNDDNGLSQHAMEYVASSVGLHGSLRDIYDALRELGMSPELAWKRAARHKFGFVDTSLPGDILKPAMYYANELKVGSLSSDEKLRLFVGKISLEELDGYPTYLGLYPEEQITEYFHLNS